MNKVVNGKDVEIKNFDLFLLGAEGSVYEPHIQSKVNMTDSLKYTEMITEYLTLYNTFISSLPFPLNNIERDMKYLAFAQFIHMFEDIGNAMAEDEHTDFWVEDGIHLVLSEHDELALHIQKDAWGVEKRKKPEMSIDELDNSACEAFAWFMDAVRTKERGKNFYKEFMPEIVEACDNDITKFKRELLSLLRFDGYIPNEMTLSDNSLVDYAGTALTLKNTRYTFDFYQCGTRKSNEKIPVFNLSGTFKISEREEDIPVYDYTVFTKPLIGNAKLQELDIKFVGFRTMFNLLCAIKNNDERDRFPVFKGFLYNGLVIFEVENVIYACSSNRLAEEPETIAAGNLYAVDNGYIYFKQRKFTKHAVQETLYKVPAKLKKLQEYTICQIDFKKRE